MSIKTLFLIATAATALIAQPAFAEGAATPELEAAIMGMDAQVFQRGFNECDLDALENTLADDLEFYHDVGGLQDREAFLNGFRASICSGRPLKPIRRLIPDSVRIFPLRSNGELYGAIQHGDHSFYERAEDGSETLTSTASFTTLWLLEGEAWKMRRVLSYDHRIPQD